MMLFPQLPLYAIAIICGILSFLVTRLSMPRIIRKLENSNLLMDVKATKFINFQPLQLLENQISIELPTAEEDIDYSFTIC